MGSVVGMTFPLAGQPGHGRTAFVRRRPVHLVDGRVEGGYTDVFEFICPGCGDNPHVDYSEVPSWLQCLRGPFTLEAALDVYDKHLGPLPGQNGDSAGSLGPGYAKASQLGNSMITVRKVMRSLAAVMPGWLIVICGVCLDIPLTRLAALLFTVGLCLIQPARVRCGANAWRGGRSYRAFDEIPALPGPDLRPGHLWPV